MSSSSIHYPASPAPSHATKAFSGSGFSSRSSSNNSLFSLGLSLSDFDVSDCYSSKNNITESLAESFADLLNKVHISGNKSPTVMKATLPFGNYSKNPTTLKKHAVSFHQKSTNKSPRTRKHTTSLHIPQKSYHDRQQPSSGFHRRNVYSKNNNSSEPCNNNKTSEGEGRPTRRKARPVAGGPSRRRSISADGADDADRRRTASFQRRNASFDSKKALLDLLEIDNDDTSMKRSVSFDAFETTLGLADNGSTAPPSPIKKASTAPSSAMSYVVSTKDYDGCHHSPSHQSNNKVDPQKLIAIMDRILQSRFEAEAYVQVADLKWREKSSPYREGRYTGLIDRKARPHGKGTWVSSGDNVTLFGWWYKGV